ncbi:MAG: hypothetical protein IIA59_04360 [Candidatus Marinimicrobia bacterium]|nr:hypothetical protein [Candidatus Neomarinimicrobiota bacterium]
MPIPKIYHYIDGELRQAGNRGFLAVELPGAVIAEVPLSTKLEAERAVESVARACLVCRQASASGRAEP